MLRKLMALGYVNAGSARSNPDLAAPADPKDRIAVFEKYHEILNLLGFGFASRMQPRPAGAGSEGGEPAHGS